MIIASGLILLSTVLNGILETRTSTAVATTITASDGNVLQMKIATISITVRIIFILASIL